MLITHAGRSWARRAVSELVIGLMIDAARGISRANIAHKRAKAPEVGIGRQLAALRPASSATDHSAVASRAGAGVRHVRAESAIPTSWSSTIAIEQVDLDDLLRRADFVLPLAVATPGTGKT